MCKDVSIDWLSQQYRYDPETGKVTKAKDGTEVTDRSHGYIRLRFKHDGKHITVQAHRAAWALVHRDWPTCQIDHINGNRADNRLCNLREATHMQNQWNRPGHTDRSNSPYPGVHPLPNGRWRGMIMVNGVRKHLGVYDTPDLAFIAYQSASREMRGQFSPV
jgi:HNH endonuclease